MRRFNVQVDRVPPIPIPHLHECPRCLREWVCCDRWSICHGHNRFQPHPSQDSCAKPRSWYNQIIQRYGNGLPFTQSLIDSFSKPVPRPADPPWLLPLEPRTSYLELHGHSVPKHAPLKVVPFASLQNGFGKTALMGAALAQAKPSIHGAHTSFIVCDDVLDASPIAVNALAASKIPTIEPIDPIKFNLGGKEHSIVMHHTSDSESYQEFIQAMVNKARK